MLMVTIKVTVMYIPKTKLLYTLKGCFSIYFIVVVFVVVVVDVDKTEVRNFEIIVYRIIYIDLCLWLLF